jgi:hypothetical protein
MLDRLLFVVNTPKLPLISCPLSEGSAMTFTRGNSGNPTGRPKGSFGGRIQALAGLDKLLARKKNQKALIAALEKDLQANPVRFFKTVIMPLLPRESTLSFDHEGVIQWRSLVAGDASSGVIDVTDGDES